MRVEVLIPTMNMKNPNELLSRMNIESDAIICNQTSIVSYEKLIYNKKNIECYSFNEKGVGLNRNNALMRSKADYCIFADDDMVFKKNYEKVVCKYFEENEDADILIFNLIEENPRRYIIRKKFRVTYRNYMRFGAARIVVKRSSILKKNILFNLNFGGGTRYSAGEDTIFLNECLKKGLKILAVPDSIAKLDDNRPSTWFYGFNEKYFKDRGALYAAISPYFSKLLAIQFVIRRQKIFKKEMSLGNAYKLMKLGIEEYKRW